MEAGVVISKAGEPIHWHLPKDRSAAFLPEGELSDRPADTHLWYWVEEHCREVGGLAHSHPGGGIPGPSREDVTTFAAWDSGFRRRLRWWIVSDDATVLVSWKGPGRLEYVAERLDPEPPWVAELRRLSRMEGSPGGA